MSDPTHQERRKRGRPKAVEPRAAAVTAWITRREQDRLIKMAASQDTSVSALLRTLLRADDPKIGTF